MDTKRLAQSLARRFGTRDPFRIADALGYIIIYAPLVGVRGFYQYLKRCHIIYLDTSLNEPDARFVCAHEVGHSVMHRGCNRIFMDTRTFVVTSRFETEANHFAVDLIYNDDDLQDMLELSLPTVATALGISEALAGYRLRSVRPA